MNIVKKGLFAFAIAVSAIAATRAVPPVTSTTVTPGVWCTDFEAALAYAEKNNLPVLAFWGESGCGYCKTLMNQGIDTDKFREWQTKRTPVMIWYHGANKTTPYKNWIKNPASGEWPYIKIYWKKADGSKVEVYFAGRDGKMPVKGGDTSTAAAVSKWITLATPGQIGGGKPNLNEQLIASFEKYCSSWTMQEAYSGGYFSVTNLPNSRLEAVAGKTSFVNIPLYRTAKTVAANKLKIGSDALVDVSWAANETSKMHKYTLPSTVKAGDVIQLKLFAADGKDLKSSSAINVVSEPANSVRNPKWIGEDFSVGEWTMDLDAAIAKSKNTGSFTLALASGTLWCPFCKSLETDVLNSAKFKDWAKKKNVNLVILDNPKRSADDKKNDSGVVVSVGSVANGAPPTLLRYAQSADRVSGAAYMSRKMIPVGSSSTADTAEWVLQRNHRLLYKGGALCAPEEMRTGYPMFILVKPDAKAAGHMLPGYDYGKNVWGVSLDETIARLNELLLLKDGDESSGKPSTTRQTMAVEADASGTLQVNANTVFYRLTNVPAGKVAFSSTDKELTLTVYEAASTLSTAKKLASGTGTVTVDFASAANKFLAVSHYSDGLKAYGENTSREFTVSSTVTLVPKDKKSEFTTKSGKMKMEIVSGKKYRLDGFSSYSAFEKKGQEYVANSTGTVDMQSDPGATVSYQLWNPGSVAFMTTSERKMEADGTCTVRVSRLGGSSGVATVVIVVDAGDNGTGRVTASPSELTWEDGNAEEKEIQFTIEKNSKFDPTEKFLVTMIAVSGSAAVTAGRFELTVSDTDNPVLPSVSYSYRFYKGVSVDESYDVQNIEGDGRVTVQREGDRIPTGLKLKYDKKTQRLLFYGKPLRAGTAEFSVRLNERRDTAVAKGEITTFKVEVVDPKSLQPGEVGYNSVMASTGAKTGIIPLYASVDGDKVLAGTVEVKIAATGRLSSKYIGVGNGKVSFSGDIAQLSDDGVISASLVKKNAKMGLSIDSEGKTVIEISGIDNAFSRDGVLEGEGNISSASSGKYEGYYTVTLPIGDESALVPAGEVYSTGTAYLTLNVASSGKVRVKCLMPNGKSASFTTYLQPDALTIDGVKWAVVPVLKSDSKNTVGVVLRIRENAENTYETDPQVVMLAHDSKGYWKFEDALTTMAAYGSYYDSGMDLFGCCTDVYGTSEFTLDLAYEWLKASERRGAITAVPTASVVFSEDGMLSVQNMHEKLHATLRLKLKTGLVSGSIPVMFEDGSQVRASFKGVLLPGWFDCGCSDSTPSVISRPFVSGTAVFSDKVDGKAVKRGFAVNLVPVE